MVREVHAGFQNKEKEAGSRCALGGFTPFLGTQAPHFPNPSSPRGLGSSLGNGQHHLCQGSMGSPVCERACYILLGVVGEMVGSLKESTN